MACVVCARVSSGLVAIEAAGAGDISTQIGRINERRGAKFCGIELGDETAIARQNVRIAGVTSSSPKK